MCACICFLIKSKFVQSILKSQKVSIIFISLKSLQQLLIVQDIFFCNQADQNQPLLWCCHVAGNSSSVSVEDQSEDNVQVDFYSYINVDRQETSQLHDSPCPPSNSFVINLSFLWLFCMKHSGSNNLEVLIKSQPISFMSCEKI